MDPTKHDGRRLHDHIQSILAMKRANLEVNTTKSRLLKKYYTRLISCARQAKMTAQEIRAYERANTIFREFEPALTSQRDFMDFDEKRAERHGIYHEIDKIPNTRVPRQRRQRMHPLVQQEFERWHTQELQANGLV